MAEMLLDRLIGAWELMSYMEEPVDGSAPTHPMGGPMGTIMYTPDGYMSAQLMRPVRRPFASGDWFDGTDEEYREEASTYIAHSGPFHVDEEKQTLTHSMFVSPFPNRTGQIRPRVVKIDGDGLHLSTEAPIRSAGKDVLGRGAAAVEEDECRRRLFRRGADPQYRLAGVRVLPQAAGLSRDAQVRHLANPILVPARLPARTHLVPAPSPRRVFSAPPQATSWSSIWLTDFSWRGSGLKVV